MNTSRSQQFAYLAAILYACIIGLSFLFVKLTVQQAHPMDVLAHRFTLSLIVVSIPIAAGWFKWSLKWRDILRIIPLGLLSPVLFFLFQAFGLVTSNSSEAGIIQATAPIFTLLMASLFLKERTTIIQKLSLLLSICGVIFILAMKGIGLSLENFQGMGLLLLSTLCFAGYGVLARPLTRRYKPMELTWVTLALGFLVFNSASLIRHAMNGTVADYIVPLMDPGYLGALGYLAILSTMGSTLLSSYALTHLEASKVSVFSNLATLISIAGGALILGEPLYMYHYVGAILIIAGVLGTNRNTNPFNVRKKRV